MQFTTVRVRGAKRDTLKEHDLEPTGNELEVYVWGQLVAIARLNREHRQEGKIEVLWNRLHTGAEDSPDDKAVEQAVRGAVVAMYAARTTGVY